MEAWKATQKMQKKYSTVQVSWFKEIWYSRRNWLCKMSNFFEIIVFLLPLIKFIVDFLNLFVT